jgi:hypothetical protein
MNAFETLIAGGILCAFTLCGVLAGILIGLLIGFNRTKNWLQQNGCYKCREEFGCLVNSDDLED